MVAAASLVDRWAEDVCPVGNAVRPGDAKRLQLGGYHGPPTSAGLVYDQPIN
jgi:hypothetical protein